MPDTFVLFVDMLGFADLVEAHPEEVERLVPALPPSSDYAEAAERLAYAFSDSLLGRFTQFHQSLESHVRKHVMEGVSAITFSDSAFIQMDSAEALAQCAIDLMTDLVRRKVPARMGIGAGSFKALRFLSDASGPSNLHATQFLGTAVVRAHRAETSGVEGLRILLHPSVRASLESLFLPRLPLPETKPHAFAEVNYVSWLPADPTHPGIIGRQTNHDFLASRVAEMSAASDLGKRHIYTNTLSALRRMNDDLVSD